jgi:hypothetical protein
LEIRPLRNDQPPINQLLSSVARYFGRYPFRAASRLFPFAIELSGMVFSFRERERKKEEDKGM